MPNYKISEVPLDERIRMLPLWARNHIKELEGDVHFYKLQAGFAENKIKSPVQVIGWRTGNRLGLDKRNLIRFVLNGDYVMEVTYADDELRIHGEGLSKGGRGIRIDITGEGSVSIRPWFTSGGVLGEEQR